MRPFRRTLSLLLATFLLGGCFTIQILPLTSEMEDIHDTYRREFSARFLPSYSDGTDPGQPAIDQSNLTGFSRTLEKIRAFQLRHPDRQTEAAHLTVLEGMIYLQLGLSESATLMQEDVRTAGRKLGSNLDYAPRDRLFADSFGELITLSTLWKCRSTQSLKPAICTKMEAETRQMGSAMCGRLVVYPDQAQLPEICGMPGRDGKPATARDDTLRAMAQGDGGPIYIAASTALAYAWAYKGAQDSCETVYGKPGMDSQRADCISTARDRYFQAASSLLDIFLTRQELDLAKQTGGIAVTAGSGGRLLYVELRRRLDSCRLGQACDLTFQPSRAGS